MPAIEVCGLVKDYPAHRRVRDMLLHPWRQPLLRVLDGVDLTVAEGEVLGIVGVNGAGKTTLLKLVGGLLVPTAGQISVYGWDTLRSAGRVRRTAAYCFSEERSFYWRLTGRQNLTFFAALLGLHGAAARDHIQALAQRLGLNAYLERPFAHYSSGIKQRFSLARALLSEPRVLLLDEPTRSIDPAEAASIWDFVRDDLARRQGVTVMLVTHQGLEAAAICDRVAVLEGGKITAELTAADLIPVLRRQQFLCVSVSGLTACDASLFSQLRGVCDVAFSDREGRQSLQVWCEDADVALQSLLAATAERGGRVLGFERLEGRPSDLTALLRGGMVHGSDTAGLPPA